MSYLSREQASLNEGVALATLRYACISCFCWHLPFVNFDPSSRFSLLSHFLLLCSNCSSPCLCPKSHLALRAFYTLTSTHPLAHISWVCPGITSGCVYQRNLPHSFPPCSHLSLQDQCHQICVLSLLSLQKPPQCAGNSSCPL